MEAPALFTEKQNEVLKKDLRRKESQSYFIVGVIVLLSIAITIFTVFFTAQLSTGTQNNQTVQMNESKSLWSITQIKPSQTPNEFDITLTSNAGNLRNYANLYSFGLSTDGGLLVTNSANGLELITLNDESVKNISPEGKSFSGDYENSISWSNDGLHFAMSILLNDNPDETYIWIFDRDGKVVSEVGAKIPVSNQNKPVVEPAKFSLTDKLIMVRTYKSEDRDFKKDDGTDYLIKELPIYLSIYNTTGEIYKDISILDYSQAEIDLDYSWDMQKRGFIKYLDYESGKKPEDITDFSYTRISID
jgi:hypothetical protein